MRLELWVGSYKSSAKAVKILEISFHGEYLHEDLENCSVAGAISQAQLGSKFVLVT